MNIPESLVITVPLPTEVRLALADSIVQGQAILEINKRLNDLEFTVRTLTSLVDLLQRRIETMQKLDPVATYLEKANVP